MRRHLRADHTGWVSGRTSSSSGWKEPDAGELPQGRLKFHQARLKRFIVSEHVHGVEESLRLLRNPLDELVRSGDILTNLQAEDLHQDTTCHGCVLRLSLLDNGPLPTHEYKLHQLVTVLQPHDPHYAAAAAQRPSRSRPGLEEHGDLIPSTKRLEERLQHLGFRVVFSATIVGVTATHLDLTSRFDGAEKMVENRSGEAVWTVAFSLDNISAQRQLQGAVGLGKLAVQGSGHLVAPVDTPEQLLRADELRVRLVLLAPMVPFKATDTYKAQARAGIRAHAGERPSWMTDEVHDQMRHWLDSRQGLNEKQIRHLSGFFNGSVSLLQGPPGTGKTQTLEAVIKAIWHVLMVEEADLGFVVPEAPPSMVDWSAHHVAAWVDSLKDVQLRGQAQVFKDEVLDGMWVATAAAQDVAALLQSSTARDQGVAARDRAVTAVLAVRDAALRALWRRGCAPIEMRMLVATDTNAAVDILLDRAHAMGCPPGAVVRLGAENKVAAHLRHYHIDRQTRRHTLVLVSLDLKGYMRKRSLTHARLAAMRLQLREFASATEGRASREPLLWKKKKLGELAYQVIYSLMHDLFVEAGNWLKSATNAGQKKAREALTDVRIKMQLLAKLDILLSAKIVLGTCISCGELHDIMEAVNLTFNVVILDEAAQSAEASSLVPLVLGAQWVVMAGDIRQLRCTVRSEDNREAVDYENGGASLFHRLQDAGLDTPVLTVQYRMHSSISVFPSNQFYGRQLTNGNPDHTLPSGFSWPGGNQASVFLDCLGQEHKVYKHQADQWKCEAHAMALVNFEQATLALRVMAQAGRDPSIRSIALITPYAGQSKLMQGMLDGMRPLLEGSSDWHPTTCDVHTIDGFQGKEADFVIFSSVRSNAQVDLGFLKDPRRLNVAITRAMRGQVIIGNYATLSQRPCGVRTLQWDESFWPKFFSHHVARRAFIKAHDVDGFILAPLPAQLEAAMCA